MDAEVIGGEELTFGRRLQHAWNAFKNKDPSLVSTSGVDYNGGVVSTTRPDRKRLNTHGLDRTIAGAIYNRIATDAASVVIQHVRLNETGGIIEGNRQRIERSSDCIGQHRSNRSSYDPRSGYVDVG